MAGKYPRAAAAERYARNVLAGKIVVCSWIRLACERHARDTARQKSAAFGYRFDRAKADKAIRFVERMPHTKGRWAARGEVLALADWQCFFVASIFGWVRKRDGLRRFRKALLLVPRKNGKSQLAAAIGLKMLAADGEYAAEVYSGATTEKQAWEVFRPARQMALRADGFGRHYSIDVNAKNIHILATDSRFEPVIGKPGDGASPSCAIIDEYHEHDTDELFDTMETGMGAREQPLMLVITTAGNNLAGPCYGLQIEAQRMLSGVIENDELFALIYTVDADDDWADPASLRKANPNYDVSVSAEFLLSRQRDAIETARKAGTFQTKHLNIWVGAREAYYNVRAWQALADEGLRIDDFAGQTCYIGLDLASKIDIAAVELLFPRPDGRYVRFGRYYLPEATVESSANEHYQGWEREGRFVVTPGNIVDFGRIRDDILADCKRFGVAEVDYDPAQATMLINELMEKGVPCVEMRPTVLNFSEPMKTLDALIRGGRIEHDGDPVMTWMLSNVVAKEDAKDNVYPRKERPESKIDGVIAHLMALGRAMAGVPKEDGYVATHGVVTL